MKNEKKSMQSFTVVAVVILFCMIGFGCEANKSGSTSVKVGPDGTSVNTNGVKIQTGNNNGAQMGAEITDTTTVQTNDDGVRVNTGNVDVKTGANGVEVDM